MTEPSLLSTKPIEPCDRLIFALDVPTLTQGREWVERLGDSVTFYKLGLEFCMSGDYFTLLRELVGAGKKVFADMKFSDVPATVRGAVANLAASGATCCTLHGTTCVYEEVVKVRGAMKLLAVKTATAMEAQLRVEEHQDSIVGKSPSMQQVFKMIGRVAHSDAPVMITGESGTGKELVARAIHHYSPRSAKTFVAINCAAIPDQLLESELFGHEKGAFTGAQTQRVGRFEQCNGGTLFLDEIGDMPLPLQSKILRVLQDGMYSRVGGNDNLKSDVRIVAATNKNLETEVAEKRFREDLFYRLNVVRIQLPPLRQRVEDVQILAEYFLARVATLKRLPRLRLSEEALRVLEAYPWPGNIRELENTIQRAVVLAGSDILLAKDLPLGADQTTASTGSTSASSSAPVELTVEKAIELLIKTASADKNIELIPWLEREFTMHAMKVTHGNQLRAAKLLGLSRATLRKRVERFHITKETTIS